MCVTTRWDEIWGRMKKDIQDQRLHRNSTNNLYLVSIIAELDTVGPTYVDLERRDCPQNDWLKDNRGKGRDIQKP